MIDLSDESTVSSIEMNGESTISTVKLNIDAIRNIDAISTVKLNIDAINNETNTHNNVKSSYRRRFRETTFVRI